LLYVGKAVDMGIRFREHNLDPPRDGNKRAKINEYFAENTTLGYGAFLFPSNLLGHRLPPRWQKDFKSGFKDLIATVESIVILQQDLENLPWNIKDGSSKNKKEIRSHAYTLAQALSGFITDDSFWLVAGDTLRKSLHNPLEEMLAYFRFQMIFLNRSLAEVVKAEDKRQKLYFSLLRKFPIFKDGISGISELPLDTFETMIRKTRLIPESQNLQAHHKDFQLWDRLAKGAMQNLEQKLDAQCPHG
jgi:hypothetical protein